MTDLSRKQFKSFYGQNEIISISLEKYEAIFAHKVSLLYAKLYSKYVTSILSCQIGPS